MNLFLNLLIAQALMGAFDTIYHHEFKVALPHSTGAQLELSIHAVRALIYGIIFFGLAWFEWHGLWVWVLTTLILIEVLLTLWDFTVEDQTRLLPKTERITHTLLAINGGAVFLLLALQFPDWLEQDSAIVNINYGWKSWFLTLAATGVALSGVRDGFAAWAVPRLESHLKLDFGKHKKFLISGGTGFIGSALCRELLRAGHELTLLTRNPVAATIMFKGIVKAVKDTSELNADEDFDIIINLAGAPVVGMPWTKKRKRKLLHSRLNVTENLLRYVRKASHKPRLWVQASAIGFYGIQDKDICEENTLAGEGFAAELCERWENLTDELSTLHIRTTILRFGLVFGRNGGSMPMLMLPFRFGFGSVMGTGTQHVSWVHIEDLLRVIAVTVTDETLSGPINVVAPECPQFKELAKCLGETLYRPVWIRIPEWLLRNMLGEMANMFIRGPIIVPGVLLDKKFEYRFPNIHSAVMDLA